MGKELFSSWRKLCFHEMLFVDRLQVLREKRNMGRLLDGLPSAEVERRCRSSPACAERKALGKPTSTLECEFHASFSWTMDVQATRSTFEIWPIQWLISFLLFSGYQRHWWEKEKQGR